MASVRYLQGVVLEHLKRTEYRGSHPEKMVKDIGEMRRVYFGLRHNVRVDRDPPHESLDKKAKESILRYRSNCRIALASVTDLLRKMKR